MGERRDKVKDEEHPSLPQVVGARLRALREATGRTQDAVAAAAYRAGLDWTRTSVAALEQGRRGLSAEEFLLLPLALTFLDEENHTLAELLEGAPSQIRRQTGALASTRFFREAMLGGAEGRVSGTANVAAVERQAAAGMDPTGALAIAHMATREAERHAAKALAASPEKIAEIAAEVFGRGLTEEREQRVQQRAGDNPSPRSLQAIRGHVTRELLDEMRQMKETRRKKRGRS